MEIIAVQGQRYLIDVGKGRGRVLDLATRQLYPPFLLESILSRGYWEAYSGDQSLLETLLRDYPELSEKD